MSLRIHISKCDSQMNNNQFFSPVPCLTANSGIGQGKANGQVKTKGRLVVVGPVWEPKVVPYKLVRHEPVYGQWILLLCESGYDHFYDLCSNRTIYYLETLRKTELSKWRNHDLIKRHLTQFQVQITLFIISLYIIKWLNV